MWLGIALSFLIGGIYFWDDYKKRHRD